MKNKIIIFTIILFIIFFTIYTLRFKNSFNKLCNENRYLDLDKKRFFVDKLHVKDYINNNFKYIKTAKVYFKTDDLKELIDYDFSKLPNKFIIKSNNGSQDVLIIDNKQKLNKIKQLIKEKYKGHVFPYGNIPIINDIMGYEKQYLIKKYYFIEEYLGKNINDYKIHVIDGKIDFLIVDSNRHFDHCQNIYNHNFNLLKDRNTHFKKCNFIHKKPQNLSLMKKFCNEFYKMNKLNFFRIDFYEIDGKLYFGEFTFTPANCFGIYVH